MFPFARVPFWVHICDPQPFAFRPLSVPICWPSNRNGARGPLQAADSRDQIHAREGSFRRLLWGLRLGFLLEERTRVAAHFDFTNLNGCIGFRETPSGFLQSTKAANAASHPCGRGLKKLAPPPPGRFGKNKATGRG